MLRCVKKKISKNVTEFSDNRGQNILRNPPLPHLNVVGVMPNSLRPSQIGSTLKVGRGVLQTYFQSIFLTYYVHDCLKIPQKLCTHIILIIGNTYWFQRKNWLRVVHMKLDFNALKSTAIYTCLSSGL